MHLAKHKKLLIILCQVNSCQCDKMSHPLRGCDVKSHYITKYYEARFARYFISLFTCDNMSHVLGQITLYYEILQYNHRLNFFFNYRLCAPIDRPASPGSHRGTNSDLKRDETTHPTPPFFKRGPKTFPFIP